MRVDIEARAVVLRLRHLSGGPELVRKAAARVLAGLPPSDAIALLQELIALNQQSVEGASAALAAFTRAIAMEREVIPHLDELRQLAALSGERAVDGLFAEGEAQREYLSEAAARADAKLFNQPLGYLKQQARLTRNPDELARLAVASNPAVVREVLRNSRLTEELVVRIAARRPARPEPLIEIYKSERWSTLPAVRRALVFNPYLPPEIGVKLVALVGRADLKEIANDHGLHVAVRQEAAVLLGEPPR